MDDSTATKNRYSNTVKMRVLKFNRECRFTAYEVDVGFFFPPSILLLSLFNPNHYQKIRITEHRHDLMNKLLAC